MAGRDVWLVHPWSLGALPATLAADTVILDLFVADFHGGWPWSAQRWRFVGSRTAELATQRWHADAAAIGAALKGARSVRCIDEPHLARFHVRGRDGDLLSGAQAFLALWAALHGWRWLARAGRVLGAARLMECTYRRFLRWRPTLQRWAFRLDAPGPDRPNAHDNASR